MGGSVLRASDNPGARKRSVGFAWCFSAAKVRPLRRDCGLASAGAEAKQLGSDNAL